MQKLSVIFSIIVVTTVFIYGLNVLSNTNTCSGVRTFDCQKNNNGTQIFGKKYEELKPTSDLFLKYCKPKITESGKNYIVDYSGCNLTVSINKDNTWVQKVVFDNTSLNRDEINKIFK